MGRKKRRGIELKPFCFYCDRDFDDEKVLVQHQKAKHFKCSECNRKLDTATGLAVHMLHVHKESISKVPNAIVGRDNPEYIVHGMEGVPQAVINERQQKLMEEKGMAKHMKSAHTVFGMGVMSGLGLLPANLSTNPAGLLGAQGFPPTASPSSLQQFQQQMAGAAPAAIPTGDQATRFAPPAPPTRPHSGIAINFQNPSPSTPTPPAPTPPPIQSNAPLLASPPNAAQQLQRPGAWTSPPQPSSNINLKCKLPDENTSIEEVVAMKRFNYTPYVAAR